MPWTATTPSRSTSRLSPERQILLEKPGPPAHDDATAEQVRELVTKGAEFTEEPTERFYGTDCGLRDPFGNHIRIGQPKEGPIEFPLA